MILAYWVIQILIGIVCISVFVRRKKLTTRHRRKDGPIEKIFMILGTPVFAFGYACMGGYPPKDDQIYFILVVTLLIYGSLIFRWIRQNRETET